MSSYEPPPPVKIKDSEGRLLQEINSVLIPQVGGGVRLFSGKEFHVRAVVTVYSPSGNYTDVTVETYR